MKNLFAFGCILFFSASVLAATLPSDIKPSDLRTYGDEKNSTILYVFSSLTCPHCAVFHKEIMPDLLTNYVDTKKAKLVYVDMPYDPKAMTGSMLARCVKPENYEKFMDVMFENQKTWVNSEKTREIITRYASILGLSEQEANNCLADIELRRTILSQRSNLADLYKVQGMPSIVVVKGNQSKLFSGTDKDEILKNINQRLEQ